MDDAILSFLHISKMNDDEDLSDVKFVEKANPKYQRRRVMTEMGGGSDTPARSSKRASIRSANKYQSQLLADPEMRERYRSEERRY